MRVPSSVGPLAQRWDEEHLGLTTAARAIAAAATGGFTPVVAAAAADFTHAWQQLAVEAGEVCTQRADALRDTVADLATTDAAVAESLS